MRLFISTWLLCLFVSGAKVRAASASFDGPDLVVRNGKTTFRLSGIVDEHAFFATVHAAVRKGRDFYLVIGSSELTRGWPAKGGNCGSGIESFIRWLHVRDGKVLETQEGLYESCRLNRDGWSLRWKEGKLIWSTCEWKCSADVSTPATAFFLNWSYDPQHPEKGIAEEERMDPWQPTRN